MKCIQKIFKVLSNRDNCCCFYFQSEAKLVDELRSSFEKQYNDELEKACKEWKEEEVSKIKDEFMKEKEQLLKVGFTFCNSVLSTVSTFISVSVRVKIEVKSPSLNKKNLKKSK